MTTNVREIKLTKLLIQTKPSFLPNLVQLQNIFMIFLLTSDVPFG